ncbi:glycoside hydrolase family 15 protein, partial [Streptomyces parvulus]|uniref:glycoside hydrolase family 15 protein n=1 Tax=Streptomyces parvulus TaxID=146923 RepID=UPI0033ED076C
MKQLPRIEQYGLIGDTQTSAHVRNNGSIDWLCLPRFDSPAVFAGLLGTQKHGTWQIAPASSVSRDGSGTVEERRYRGDSLVLESLWRTPTGSVRVLDFMPPRDGTPQVIRIVEGVTGVVEMVSAMRPKPGYGSVSPWIHEVGGRMVAEAGADALWLDTCVPQVEKDGVVVSAFAVAAGQSVAFVLSWCPSHAAAPDVPDPEAALTETLAFWQGWTTECTYEGPYREAVVRSLIALKAMTYGPSGGIVAAPTTSLPELIGGDRNWDYRFTWLRDASTTLAALLGTGYRQEAQAWRRWLLRAVAGDPENLQIMYGITGERDLRERELPWLPGYEGSTPVRIGNGAADQLQLDVYGEVIETLYLAHQSGVAHCADTAVLHRRLVEHLSRRWREPDEGIWEIRGARRHFVHSKVMAWVAVDRTIRLAEAGALDMDPAPLVELRSAIHHEVCTEVSQRWWQAYERYLQVGDGEVDVFDATGNLLRFTARADGTYTTPAGYSKDLKKNADGTYTLTDRKSGTKDTYNEHGTLLKVTDKNKGTITVDQHDEGGEHKGFKLTETRSGRWIDLVKTYPNQWQAKDHTGRTAVLDLDSAGNLAKVTDTNGKATTYEYDGSRRVTKVTTPEDTVTLFTYDGHNRVRSMQRATESTSAGHTGPTWRYDYTAATPADAGTTTVTDPDGDATKYVHNADGEVTKVTDPLGHARHATYKNHLTQTAIDAMGTGADGTGGNTTTYGWDGR